MDEMQEWEISLLADSIKEAYREEWEMTRWIVWSIIQPHLKPGARNKPMKDVLPLPFDDEVDEHEIEITNSEIERLKQHSEMLAQRMKNINLKNGSKQS